jgi:ribonuclease D
MCTAIVRRDTASRGDTVAIHLYQNDLPADLSFGDAVAIDSETMGLNLVRDRLCLVQLSSGDGDCHLVQFADRDFSAPNLRRLLTDPQVTKIFHYARFDLAMLERHLGVETAPVYCTKTASKLVRTYTDKHGLKDLCKELLGVELSKQQQSSDWGAAELSQNQMNYAAADVLYLHELRQILDGLLAREGRSALAQQIFAFLPVRARLDLMGWDEVDIFAHS